MGLWIGMRLDQPAQPRKSVDAGNIEGGNSAARNSDHATRVLDIWSTVLPARIVNEDIGHRVALGQRLTVWLRVIAAVWWTAINSIGYLRKQLGKRSGA